MTEAEWPDLEGGEAELDGSGEQLWRNVHPNFIDGDQITTQAFSPTKKDEGKLSSARSTKVSAGDHYDEFTGELGLVSAGVWAVSVSEVGDADLRAVDDSASQSRPDPCPKGHAFVDFRAAGSAGKIKRAAGKLRDSAVARGCIHP